MKSLKILTKLVTAGLVWLLLLGSFSCVTVQRKKAPIAANALEKKEFDQIQIDLATGSERRAMSRLKKLVATYPNSDISDDAYIAIGKLHFKAREYDAAYQAFMSVVNADTFSPSEAESLLWAAKSLNKLGRQDEALGLAEKTTKIPGISDEMRLDAYKMRFTILSDLGDRLDALRAAVYVAEKDPDPSSKESYRVRAMDLVDSRLTDTELESVTKASEFGFVRGSAFFRVGQQAFEQRDFSRARDKLTEVASLMPETDLAEKAKSLIEQIDSRRQVDSKTIGAVLPLTGKYSAMAQKTLRGLQLGLGIYGGDRSDLRLAVVDSEGNPDGARRAVERLVTEDHVIAVVGSLLSKTAVSVAAKADELGVPSIALSQKSGLTDVGETVFRNSLTSEMQVRHLVKTAMEKLGLKRFAILYPNDPYGVEFANLFWDEVLAHGGSISGAQPYSSNDTDFSEPVRRLIGRYYLEDRATEYKYRLTEYFKKQKALSARQKPSDDILPPIVDFDAIFIPDGIKAIGQIAPTLAYYDVDHVRLLGTNLWNSEDLLKKADRHIDGAVFVDSFLVTDPSFTNTRFYKEFQRVFGEAPGPFEAQAYDAGLILRQALNSGRRTRADLMDQINRLSDFPGAIGRLNLSSGREISRPIASLTLSEGKVMRLEDAPPAASSATSPPKKVKAK